MNTRLLTPQDLAAALILLDDYEAIRVFADDVDWDAPSVRRLHNNPPRYVAETDGGVLALDVLADAGVIQASFLGAGSPGGDASVEGPDGERDEAALRAQKKKGEGWRRDLLLGVLVAGEPAGAGASRRIFTLRFDPIDARWRVYDGDLQRWMKRELLPPHPTALAS
jgi:hypothetical protein